MIAHRHADVAALNTLAREHLQATGALDGPELQLPGGDFAAGDQVVIKRNQPQLRVINGDRGRVLAVDPDHHAILIQTDGRRVRLDAAYLHQPTDHGDPSLLHGSAITCHVAQGITVDHAHMLADHGLSRELGYTALSCGRHANHLHAHANSTTRTQKSARPTIGPATRSSASPPRSPLARHNSSRSTPRQTATSPPLNAATSALSPHAARSSNPPGDRGAATASPRPAGTNSPPPKNSSTETSDAASTASFEL